MEAKDTEMSDEVVRRLIKEFWDTEPTRRLHPSSHRGLLQAQAEISFKAGYKQRKAEELPYYNEERQRGRKEVVEFEDELLKGVPNYGWQGYLERRRAKLKEWGLVK